MGVIFAIVAFSFWLIANSCESVMIKWMGPFQKPNTLFLLQLPRLGTVQIIMIMVGRLFGAFGFGLVYLYTAELFPTKIRNTAIGTCSSIARIGT